MEDQEHQELLLKEILAVMVEALQAVAVVVLVLLALLEIILQAALEATEQVLLFQVLQPITLVAVVVQEETMAVLMVLLVQAV
jgi:hypothetical protein